MAYAILELESIPRGAGELNAVLIDARRATRRRNLSQFAALNMVVWALLILLVYPHMQATPTDAANHVRIYLPMVAR
jgi:hypothetical protein